MPKLAHDIIIDPRAGAGVLRIDGENFPYFVAIDGASIEPAMDSNQLHKLHLTILFDGAASVAPLPGRVLTDE